MRLSDEVIGQFAQVSLTIPPIECDFRRPIMNKRADAARV
jgi:hypothetical protein